MKTGDRSRTLAPPCSNPFPSATFSLLSTGHSMPVVHGWSLFGLRIDYPVLTILMAFLCADREIEKQDETGWEMNRSLQ